MSAKSLFIAVLFLAFTAPAWGGLSNSSDIGNPDPNGSISGTDPDYTIIGVGADIWGDSDQFFYAWETDPVIGDFTAIVMVESMVSADPNTANGLNGWAKAGIMARDGAAANAMHTSIVRSYTNGANLQYRNGTGWGSGGAGLPGGYATGDVIWLKLDRMGNLFAASWATDNGGTPNAWQTGPTFNYAPSMPTSVSLGLATTSHTDNDTQANSVQVVYKNWSVGALSDFPPLPGPWAPPADAPKGGMGTLGVREVYRNGDIGDQGACQNSISNPGPDANVVDWSPKPNVFNIFDSDQHGHFPNNESAYGVVQAGVESGGNVDNVSILAQGKIRITEAGLYTFGVNSDDGFTLFFPGQDFDTASLQNCEPAFTNAGTGMRYYGGRGASDSLGVVNLPVGDHPFWVTYHEGGGGASAELFAAKGAHTSVDMNAGIWNLVGGDPIPGKPAIPNPPDVTSAAGDGWDVVVIYNTADPDCRNLGNAVTNVEYYWANGVPLSGDANTGVADAINYSDPQGGGGGKGFPQSPFPGDANQAEDNFGVGAKGILHVVQDGTYRFITLGDDSSRFRILGTTGWTSSDEVLADGFQFTGCCRDSWGEVYLTVGDYDAELIWQEGGGGAYIGLWVSVDGSNLGLLGDGTQIPGIPDTPAGLPLVPEPASLVLLALGALGVLARRSRR